MQLDILAFGAHPDDVELSACGTLMKAISQGKKVGIVDLTKGELGTRGTAETRAIEAAEAAKILGIDVRVNLGMRDGFFQNDEENQRLIIEQIRRFRPKVVLANAVSDRHPDHSKGAKLVADACFLSGLRRIETSFDGIAQEAFRPTAIYHYVQEQYLNPDFVVDVTPFYDRKMEAIKAYSTQFFDASSKEPATPISGEKYLDYITGRMVQYGRSINVNYAEGFTTARIPGIEDLFDLL
ncbi:MAG: bacillithiol biosynthesis deacetylase BshB1 [Bacteroidota bacterium]